MKETECVEGVHLSGWRLKRRLPSHLKQRAGKCHCARIEEARIGQAGKIIENGNAVQLKKFAPLQSGLQAALFIYRNVPLHPAADRMDDGIEGGAMGKRIA